MGADDRDSSVMTDKKRMQYNTAHLMGFVLEDAGLPVDEDAIDKAAEFCSEEVDAAAAKKKARERRSPPPNRKK